MRPGLDQDKEERKQSIGFAENREYSNEEKTKNVCNNYDENVHKSDGKSQVRFGQEKLNNAEKSKEEHFYKKTKRKKLNEMSENSSEDYVKMFRDNYKVENEITSKLYKDTQLKYDTDLQKQIMNEVRQNVNEKIKSYKNKTTVGKEEEEEKKQKFGNYAKELILKLKSKEPRNSDLPGNSFTNVYKFNGQNQDLKKDIKQGFDEEAQLKLNEKVFEKLDGEKTLNNMEVDSEFQNELGNESIPGKLKENQNLLEENNEKDENIQLQLEMEIDPKLQQHGDINLQLFIKFEGDSESQNDLDNKFEEELRKKQSTSGIQIKVKNCVQVNSEFEQESHEKLQKEFEGEKYKSVRDESVESVEKRQEKLNLEREVYGESSCKTLHSNESEIPENSNENIKSYKENQVVSVDMEQRVDAEKQVYSNIEQIILGKIEKLFEKVHDVFEGEDVDDVDEELTEDELQKKISEILKKVDYLEQEIDKESEKKIIEEINKISSPSSQLKLLKQFYLAFERRFTPIEERIKQICKNYFPHEMVLDFKNDTKKKINELLEHLEKTVVQKDDKIQTELKRNVSTELDCSDVEDKMQEEIGDKVEGSRIEFEEKLDEKELEDSDVNYKEEIQKDLDNLRREKSDSEMLENYGVSLDEILKKEKQEDSDIKGTTHKSPEEELVVELQKNIDVPSKMQEELEDIFDKVQKNYKKESDEENSYIDVEGFDEEEREREFDIQSVLEFTGESLQKSDEESEEESEEENKEDFGKCVDINIVTEVVEDYIVEKSVQDSTPVETFISTNVCSALDKFCTAGKEVKSSTEELNTVERSKRINKKVKQKCFTKEQVKFNENVQEHNFVGMQQKFKNFIETIKDLDEIPPELKIEQEQIDNKFQKRFREFQEDFYKMFKQEYDKGKKMFNSDLTTLNEQKQTYYELKNEFHKIKEEYKSFVLQKFFEDLQQKIDRENLLSIEELPKELNDNLFPQIDEHIEKEFAEIERDCYGLEPEFKYNVPLEFEFDGSSKNNKKKLKKKPFDLFKKLHSIHQKKLCEFAKATTWPENVS